MIDDIKRKLKIRKKGDEESVEEEVEKVTYNQE
jgi:plasmid stability protein